MDEKKYTGRGGYRGGGRKPTGVKRVSINISGQPEQIDALKDMAKTAGMTVSGFIFDKTGVNTMSEKKWFVANDNGDIIGHDLSEMKAKLLAGEMAEKEPEAGWEAICSDDE